MNSSTGGDDMKTLSACITKLDKLGFTAQFKATEEGNLKSLTSDRTYTPEQVTIVNFYRFEGPSNPDDSAILYAIRTESEEMGTLIDAYGAYDDPEVNAFIRAVESIQKKVDTDMPMKDL